MVRYLVVTCCMAIGLAAMGCAGTDDAAFDHYDRIAATAARGGDVTTVAQAPPPASDSAAPELTDRSTLSDYLVYAATHSPAVEAEFFRWKAQLERIAQDRSLPDPQISYEYFVSRMMFGPDMAQRGGVNVSQTVPWLGKLIIKGDMAAIAAQAQFQRYEAARLKLANAVKEAYYEYAYVLQAIRIARENVELLRSFEGVAQARYRTAAGSQPDVLRLQVELGKMENELATMNDMLTPTAAKLNAALNRPQDTPLPSQIALAQQAAVIGEQELIAWLKANNPELKAMSFDEEREKRSIELARQDYFPDITITGEWFDMTSVPGAVESPKDSWAIMGSMNVPIWWDKYAAGVREARDRHRAAVRDRQSKTNSMETDLKMAAYNFRNAQRKITLYRDVLIPRAQQTVRSTLASYQTGASPFGDLIDAQKILLEFQLSYERSLADRQQSLAQIEMLAGKPVERVPAAATQAAATQTAQKR